MHNRFSLFLLTHALSVAGRTGLEPVATLPKTLRFWYFHLGKTIVFPTPFPGSSRVEVQGRNF